MENLTYKPLADTFRKHGNLYTLLQRTARVALYHLTSGGGAWEVVRIQRHDGRMIGGTAVAAAEFLPGDESWGRLGWTFKTRAGAEARYAEEDAHLLAKEATAVAA